MTEDSKLILLADVIKDKERKEKELAFYKKELAKIMAKIAFHEAHLSLTQRIIDMIEAEQVVDIRRTR